MYNPPPRFIRGAMVGALLLLSPLLASCEEDKSSSGQPPRYYVPPEEEGAAERPEPVDDSYTVAGAVDICEEGDVRCVATNLPHTRTCARDETTGVAQWEDRSCPEGEVCNRGTCGPLSCEPGRFACQDLSTKGTCNARGDGLEMLETCEDDEVCRGGVCLDRCESARLEKSYIGCDYLSVPLPNNLGENTPEAPFALVVSNPDPLSPLRIRVANSDGHPARIHSSREVLDRRSPQQTRTVVKSVVRSSEGIVELSNVVDDVEIPPGGIATLLLDTPSHPVPSTSGLLRGGSYRLTSTHPVVAYQFNPYCCNYSYTNDASLLLPVPALGTEYVQVGVPDLWTLDAGLISPTSLAVAASEDNTVVDFYLPEESRVEVLENVTQSGNRVTVRLDAGEVYHLVSQSPLDRHFGLTGTLVTSTKLISAFSSHFCTNIPQEKFACDHLEEQLLPTETWGKSFQLAPTASRGPTRTEVTYWRIQTGMEGARITLGGTLDELEILPPLARSVPDCRFKRPNGPELNILVLEPMENCMLATRKAFKLESSKPIEVAGFLAGEEASGFSTGDPSMFQLPPDEQFRRSYTFLTPETYADDYASVLIPEDAVGTLRLDAKPLDLAQTSGRKILGSHYVVVHIKISDGPHQIEANIPFGLLVYAYDQYVSYAYPGGLNLTKRP